MEGVWGVISDSSQRESLAPGEGPLATCSPPPPSRMTEEYIKGVDKVGQRQGVGKEEGWGGGGGGTASDQGAATTPRWEPLVKFLSEPPAWTVDREGRKVAVPQGKGQGRLSGIWDMLLMGW